MVVQAKELQEIGTIVEELCDALAPPLRVGSQEWLDEHGILPALSSAIPGRWRTFPYQRGVFDAWDDPDIEEIDLCFGTQLGKSAIWQQLCAYCAKVTPGPALIITANQDSAREVSQTRLYPMLVANSQTSGLLPPRREQHDFLVNMRDMLIYFGWSGSATRLGEKSIRYVFESELDKFSDAASTEGDPESLGEERTKAFPNSKILKESTPSTEATSRIWRNWLRSDQRTYHVPCPHCGVYQPLVMGTSEAGEPGIKWDKLEDGTSDPDLARMTAWYECADCHEAIRDRHKPGMIRKGVWVRKGEHVTKAGKIAGEPERAGRRAGFHLSSLYSAFLTFGQVAEAFLIAKSKGQRDLQNFVNGWLAEPWKEGGDAPMWEDVRERLRVPGMRRRIIPAEAEILTAATDIHDVHINYGVWAWGPHSTGWLIDSGECRNLSEVKQLVLDVNYEIESGAGATRQVQIMAVDAGYRPAQTYQFCRDIGPRALPIKGQPSHRAPYTFSKVEMNPTTGQPIPGGIQVCNINVSDYKNEIYHVLNTRVAGEIGTLNLPEDVSENFCRQLCGEALRKGFNKRGYEVMEWVVLDKVIGNHYLDITVYAMCMADLLGLKTLHMRNDAPREHSRARSQNKTEWVGDTKGWL